ncbi:hypothetical protein OG292_06510 [Streptomyces sp. NBC_01511]|uniref:hypothetical protein n=1 Tax=Streptomyces sp. NBC_01511 TaxID=2903889 RepID=UPI00386E33ED
MIPKTPKPARESARHGLRIGMIVFDRRQDMVAKTIAFSGPLVHLLRPSGLNWQASRVSLRPGTPYERRQIAALAKLHQQRRPML